MPNWFRLKQWWRQRTQKPSHFYEFGSDDDQQWITIAFERGQCADCGGSQFIEGPSGGMSTNIQCYQCGQAWNHSVLIVTRNAWNQFGWPSTICTRCSESCEVSGDMHGQFRVTRCHICYGHGAILLHEPTAVHVPPSGGSSAQPPKPIPVIAPAEPQKPKLSREARRKIRLRKEQL